MLVTQSDNVCFYSSIHPLFIGCLLSAGHCRLVVSNKMGVVLSEGTHGKVLPLVQEGVMGWGSTDSALEDEEHTTGVAIALGEEQVNV